MQAFGLLSHIAGEITIYHGGLIMIFIKVCKKIDNINPWKSEYGQYSWLQLYSIFSKYSTIYTAQNTLFILRHRYFNSSILSAPPQLPPCPSSAPPLFYFEAPLLKSSAHQKQKKKCSSWAFHCRMSNTYRESRLLIPWAAFHNMAHNLEHAFCAGSESRLSECLANHGGKHWGKR